MPDYHIHPERTRPRFQPIKAMRHMGKLIEDKEDTEQVFHIINALNGNALEKDFERFLATEAGAARYKDRRYLAPILDDHSRIKDLPEGTVGQAYLKFMKREGLTAMGLVEESEKFAGELRKFDDDLLWYGNRLRDTHDLFHVLSGYGRDALGEASLLGFSYGQNKGRGIIFIGYMGARQIRKYAPKDARVMDSLWEGKRNGVVAKKIVEQDILRLLEEPLDAARERLGIAKPLAYHRTLKAFDEAGLIAAPQPTQKPASEPIAI